MKFNAITSTSSTGTATPLARLSRMSTVFALAMALWVAAAAPAGAQQMGIIATVNNAPISEYDLRARLELVMALSGLPRNRQTVQQLAPKVWDPISGAQIARSNFGGTNLGARNRMRNFWDTTCGARKRSPEPEV